MKKTILSFLCIGSTCMLLAQQTKPTDPNKTPSQLTPATQQPAQPNTLNPSVNQAIPNNPNVNSQTPNPVTPPNMNNNQATPERMANESNNTIGNTPPNSNYNTGVPFNNTATANPPAATYSVTVPSSVQTSFQAAYPAAATVTWQQSGDWYRARYKDENGKLVETSYREDGRGTFTRSASPLLRTYVPEEAVNKAVELYGANIYAIALVKGSEGDMYNVTVIENGASKTMWMNADGSAVMNPYRTEESEQKMTTVSETTTTSESTEPVTAPADSIKTPEEGTTHDHDQMMKQETDTIQSEIRENEPSELDESGRLNRDANKDATDDVQPEEEYEYYEY